MTEQAQICDRTQDSGPAQTRETCFNPTELLRDFSTLIASQRPGLSDDFGINFGGADRSSENGDRLPQTEDQKMFDAITQKLRELGADNRFSGQLVISKDGVPIFNYTDGVADRTSNTPINDETKMRIGSMGKMFTALAVMQLHEQGLDLDSPLSKFNTGFPDKELADKITIRQLLTHQAGVGDSLNEKFDANRDNLHNLDDFVRLFESGERNPQDIFKYSNYGYMLLGKVVESVTGQSFADYVQKNIFDKADMTHSSMKPDAEVPGVANAYENTNGRLDDVSTLHPLFPTPAGGAFSTAGDIARFMAALQNGKLLRPQLVASMTRDAVLADRESGDRYGFGMEVKNINGIQAFGHAGGFNGTVANTLFFPGSRYSYSIISNISDAPNIPAELLPAIDKIITDRIKRK